MSADYLTPPPTKREKDEDVCIDYYWAAQHVRHMGNIALWLPSMYNFYLLMLLLAFILPFGFIITIKSANYCWCYPFLFLFWLLWFDGIEKLITSCWLFIWNMLLIFFHTDLLLAIFAIFVYNWEFQFLGVIQVSACCTKTVLISNTALTFYH